MFADLLKQKIKELGVTQAEAAGMVGVSQPEINQYLNGKKKPSVGRLKTLALFLGVGVEELVAKLTEDGQ